MLDQLPVEVLNTILAYLCKRCLYVALCVNHHMSEVAVRILWREVTLSQLCKQIDGCQCQSETSNKSNIPWYYGQHVRLLKFVMCMNGHDPYRIDNQVNIGSLAQSPGLGKNGLKRKLSRLIGDQDLVSTDSSQAVARQSSFVSVHETFGNSQHNGVDFANKKCSSQDPISYTNGAHSYFIREFSVCFNNASQAYDDIELPYHYIRLTLPLLTHCKSIDLGYCAQITDELLLKLPLDSLQHTLRRLSLQFCPMLSDQAISHTVDALPLLMDLNLNGCSNAADLTSLSILKLAQLKNLHLKQCRNISTDILASIFDTTQFVNLSLSDCTNMSDSCLDAIARNSRYLVNLQLDRIQSVSDEFIEKLAINCAKLEQLSVDQCSQLTNRSLQFLNGLTDLKRLNFTLLSNITNYGINNLIAGSKFSCNLREIYLGKCTNITNEAVITIANHCPSLKHIYLAGCSAITDEGIIYLVTHCAITVLSIPGTSITDASLSAAVSNLSQILQVAQFSYCDDITPNACARLAYHCQKTLVILQLVCCRLISYDSWVKQFSQPVPSHIRGAQYRAGYCAIRPPYIAALGTYYFDNVAQR
ncbi:hypothetical protein MIR68_008908 [Amoeboaphelidium protococcarum]|nr:hypothetical protein MIR68_008908 [Amoeboaphelidium protococcarum]